MKILSKAILRGGFSLPPTVRYRPWIQPVNATDWAKRSAGV